MRTASLIAASVLALTLAACGDSKPAASAMPDPAAIAAATDAALAEATAKADADAVGLHAEPGPSVYFVNLRDGMTVPQSFRVVFGAFGIGVAPAGVDKPNTGHHHLLIDTELTAEEMQYAIPKDDQHRHFGGGETETVLMLGPGQHTLQLVFGDMNHELHKPTHIMSKKITITVK
jgi:hypothetical protein